MRMLEYNEMMSILFFSQPPVAPKPGEGGSTARSACPPRRANAFGVSYQPSAELLQKTFDRMK
jgi:hypothetical protein